MMAPTEEFRIREGLIHPSAWKRNSAKLNSALRSSQKLATCKQRLRATQKHAIEGCAASLECVVWPRSQTWRGLESLVSRPSFREEEERKVVFSRTAVVFVVVMALGIIGVLVAVSSASP